MQLSINKNRTCEFLLQNTWLFSVYKTIEPTFTDA